MIIFFASLCKLYSLMLLWACGPYFREKNYVSKNMQVFQYFLNFKQDIFMFMQILFIYEIFLVGPKNNFHLQSWQAISGTLNLHYEEK